MSSSETKKAKHDNNEQQEAVFIGLDVGTQSTKALLYHPHSQKILARSSSAYDLDKNGTDDEEEGSSNSNKGRAEQHPNKWIKAIHLTITELMNSTVMKPSSAYVVAGIGVSGQQHGMVALDKDYKLLRSAKLWCDVEASQQALEFSTMANNNNNNNNNNTTAADTTKNGGWSIPAGFTAPKVLWMKQTEPYLWEQVRHIILPHDYINLCLRTGLGADLDPKTMTDTSISTIKVHDDNGPTTDAGDASGTGLLLNPQNRQDYDMNLATCIDEKYEKALPKILPPNAISGYLSSEWKQVLNIPTTTNSIPISIGSGDNMMSALGCQCVSPGSAVLSLGTSGTIFGVSETPVQSGTPVAPFCDATGKFLPLVCVMSCTGVLNSVLENWCNNNDNNGNEKKVTHEEATELAKSLPAGCYGLTFLPYLGGERTPNWPDSTGALLGLTHQTMTYLGSGNDRVGLLYRVAMEGITYLLADAFEQMRQSCTNDGFSPKSLLVVGGGSKNPLWRQMLADVLNMELKFPLESETAALGAAFQAGAAVAAATTSGDDSSVSVEEYVLKQKIELENEVVRPTGDESVLSLYRDGLKRYREFARKLND